MCLICSHFALYLLDYFSFFKLLRKSKTRRYSLFVDLREAELFCSTLLLIVEPKQDKKKSTTIPFTVHAMPHGFIY